MKTFVYAAVSALALAGCGAVGGNPKSAMVKACTEGGDSEKNCTCIADSLEKNLDKPTFRVVANALAAGEEEGGKVMDELPAEQQTKIMGALMAAGMGCMMGGVVG